MKFSAVLIFAAGAFAADWNAIARAVTPVGQICKSSQLRLSY